MFFIHLKNSIFGFVFLLVGIFLLYTSYQYPKPVSLEQDAMFFPKILLWIWVVLAGLVAVQDVLRNKALFPKCNMTTLGSVIILVGSACLLLNVVGFIPVSLCFFILYSLTMGFRKLPQLLVISIVFTAFVWWLFTFILEIPLPEIPF